MLETKSLSVAPSKEEETIDIFSKFGWSLLSTQEVKTKDSHIEKHGDTFYNVTETEHYIKLTFQRDKNMPNYDEIANLENQYYSLSIPKCKKSILGILFYILGAIFCLAALIFLGSGFSGSGADVAFGIIFGVIAIALAVGSFILGSKFTSKNDDLYRAEMKVYDEKTGIIFEKLSALIQ